MYSEWSPSCAQTHGPSLELLLAQLLLLLPPPSPYLSYPFRPLVCHIAHRQQRHNKTSGYETVRRPSIWLFIGGRHQPPLLYYYCLATACARSLSRRSYVAVLSTIAQTASSLTSSFNKPNVLYPCCIDAISLLVNYPHSPNTGCHGGKRPDSLETSPT